MAEHVFESDIVEEFYNSCHGKDGRFCSATAKGRGIKRVPMSDAARASNAAIRGKAAKMRKKAAAKQEQSKGAMAKMGGQAAKVKPKEQYGSGKTEPGALKLTQKYGTRQAGGAAVNRSVRPIKDRSNDRMAVKGKDKSNDKGIVARNDPYGSGKTNPSALKLTQQYGTRGAGRGTSKTVKAPSKYKDYGSGKTDPEALKLTAKYGARRG